MPAESKGHRRRMASYSNSMRGTGGRGSSPHWRSRPLKTTQDGRIDDNDDDDSLSGTRLSSLSDDDVDDDDAQEDNNASADAAPTDDRLEDHNNIKWEKASSFYRIVVVGTSQQTITPPSV